jgi:hypothetical protein
MAAAARKTWMAGKSLAMTKSKFSGGSIERENIASVMDGTLRFKLSSAEMRKPRKVAGLSS